MVNPGALNHSLELKKILVQNETRTLLDIPQLILKPAKITALVGPNGSGKTTFLKALHGLTPPELNKSEFDASVLRNSIHSALVLHHTPLIKGSTYLNLKILKDVISDLTDSDIEQALFEYGLMPLKDQVATKLSAGERQRLCLARARLQQANLILLDEPTANLDPNATDQIEHLILKMSNEGVHFIIATHDLGQVKRLCEHVLLLAQGQVAEYTDTHSFFNAPSSATAQSFIARQLGWQI